MFSLYFYPRSPCGERPSRFGRFKILDYFYPRSPCGERHLGAWQSCDVRHFYPRSPCGERRPEATDNISYISRFLSTLSLRRATVSFAKNYNYCRYFYPRSPCGERRRSKTHDRHKTPISIHALLAESDFRQNYECFEWIKFLSTLSLRRATPEKSK